MDGVPSTGMMMSSLTDRMGKQLLRRLGMDDKPEETRDDGKFDSTPEDLEPITDIVPGEIVTCLICMGRVAITKVEGGLVRHFDSARGKEIRCGVRRDDIVKDGDLDERTKHIFNVIWRRLQITENRLNGLEDDDSNLLYSSSAPAGDLF